MKRMATKVRLVEEENAGLVTLLNKPIVLFCANYIYAGTLTGINDNCVELTDAKIVYETGELTAAKWKDAQSLGSTPHFVMLSAIESFGTGK